MNERHVLIFGPADSSNTFDSGSPFDEHIHYIISSIVLVCVFVCLQPGEDHQ